MSIGYSCRNFGIDGMKTLEQSSHNLRPLLPLNTPDKYQTFWIDTDLKGGQRRKPPAHINNGNRSPLRRFGKQR
jgi:hypothetical protein